MNADEMPAGRGPIEPSADTREFAKNVREMFIALMAEGFTERQALIMVGEVIRGGMAQ